MSHRKTPSNSGGSTSAAASPAGSSASASGGAGGHHNIFQHIMGSNHSIHSNDSSTPSSNGSNGDQKRQQSRLAVPSEQHDGQQQREGVDLMSTCHNTLPQGTANTTDTTTTTDSSNNNKDGTPSSGSRQHSHNHRSSKSHRAKRQSLLTKALLSYLNFFRVVQPLVSLAAFGTITPVLTYFRTQTIFPTIQATLYLFTATLACCSLFFSIIYLIDVLYHKPLFWPFNHRHLRPTSKARIGGDLIICMVFSGLWFLSGVGLVIDTVWVDCGKLTGLEGVFADNHRKLDRIRTVCQLEKATLGLAVVSWACWMGVLLVLLYGHFWKRRQVIAERLRDRLSRRRPTTTEGTSSAVATHPASSDNAAAGVNIGGAMTPSGASVISGRGVGGASGSNNSNNDNSTDRLQLPQHQQGGGRRQQESSGDFNCQDQEGEVGLAGIICRYDDEEGGSTIGQGSRRSRT